MDENAIPRVVVDGALTVNRGQGPGLLESVYERALAHDLAQRGVGVERQVSIPIEYQGVPLNFGAALMKDGIVRCVNGREE